MLLVWRRTNLKNYCPFRFLISRKTILQLSFDLGSILGLLEKSYEPVPGANLLFPQDKYLRSVADFRNLQERARREQQAAKDFAIQRFAKDLIESIDNLDLALSNVPAEKVTSPESKETGTPDTYKELRELYGGLQMTSTVFLNTLRKHGLERFDPSENGDKFDPNLHEATFQAPQPGKEDGTVFHTVQKGFLLNGRVLRAPKVGVVKNS